MTRILDRNNVPIGELGSEKRTVVPYASIPKLFVQAVVAAEDADYFKHGGVDYMGMARAFITNVLRGRKAQGGSTITQQVIKNLLLTPERSMKRKVQEIILAHRLSEKLSKEDILALYLNQIYYGHGRYGCEEAARYFFGKSVKEIDLAEAALLAGLPQSPERLSPRKHPDAAKARQRYVLGPDGRPRLHRAQGGGADRGPADPPGARDRGGARAGRRGGRRRRARCSPTSWASRPRTRSARPSRRRWTRSCRSWRASRSSGAWRISTRARASAGRRVT